MQVLRLTALNRFGRNVITDYVATASVYKFDKRIGVTRTWSDDANKEPKGESHVKTAELLERHPSGMQAPNFQQIASQLKGMLRDIKMKDMSEAPQPVFWYSAAALLPLLGPPISFVLFGYSPFLATLQLVFGATLCSFAGGMKWGYALDGVNHKPTWENLGWAVVPQMIGCFSLLLPQSLALATIAAGVAISAFVDLTATNYPKWFRSIRLALTIPAVLGLCITFLYRIVH